MEFTEFVNAFKEAFDVRKDIKIQPYIGMSEILDWNSMAIVNAIVFFDDIYDIDVSANDIKQCHNFNDLFNLLKR